VAQPENASALAINKTTIENIEFRFGIKRLLSSTSGESTPHTAQLAEPIVASPLGALHIKSNLRIFPAFQRRGGCAIN
jgi:hypothetical protein